MKKNFVLSHHDYDMTKRWYIRFAEKNKANRAVVKKIYGGINRGKTIEERKAIANALIEKLSNGVVLSKKQDAVNQIYIDLLQVLESIKHTIRKGTIGMYQSKINVFSKYCEKNKCLEVNEITIDLMNQFYVDLSCNNMSATYSAYKIVLPLLFQKIDKRYLALFENVQSIKINSTPSKYFSKNMIDSLKDTFQKEDSTLWFFCQTIYFTLIRPNELINIKIKDIDFENSSITVNGNISKNKKTQTVAIPSQLKNIFSDKKIHEYPNHFYLFGNGSTPSPIMSSIYRFSCRHKYLLEKYNYDTSLYRIYSWKHTGAVAMVKAGIHIKFIKDQGRWHSLDMVDKYLRQLGAFDMSEVREKHVM